MQPVTKAPASKKQRVLHLAQLKKKTIIELNGILKELGVEGSNKYINSERPSSQQIITCLII